jgi:hypothetical protein
VRFYSRAPSPSISRLRLVAAGGAPFEHPVPLRVVQARCPGAHRASSQGQLDRALGLVAAQIRPRSIQSCSSAKIISEEA